MLTLLLLFLVIYLVCGALGLGFRVSFAIFKWVFLALLVIGVIVFIFTLMLPAIAVILMAIAIYAVFYAIGSKKG